MDYLRLQLWLRIQPVIGAQIQPRLHLLEQITLLQTFPMLLILLIEDDSGFENNDNITKIQQPRFEITGISTTRDSLRLIIDGGWKQ